MASGGFGTRWMTDLIINIVKESWIPDAWIKSIPLPVYKGKGDHVCGSYRAIKLLELPMKVLDLSLVVDGFKCKRCDRTIEDAGLAEGLVVDGETYGCVIWETLLVEIVERILLL